MVHDQWFDLISAAADDELDGTDAARLEEHLAGCAECRDLRRRFEQDRRRACLHQPPHHGDLAAQIAATRVTQRRRATATTLARRATMAAAAVIVVFAGSLGLADAEPTGATEERAHEVTINADDDAFDHAEVTVPVGSTVDWHNRSGEDHQLVRRVGAGAIATDLAPGSTERSTFEHPGEFAYVCTIHPAMAGRVVVTS